MTAGGAPPAKTPTPNVTPTPPAASPRTEPAPQPQPVVETKPDPAPVPTPEPAAPAETGAPTNDTLAPLAPGAGIGEVWGRVRELAGKSRRDRMVTSWLTLKSVEGNKAVVAVQDPNDYRAAANASERLGELFKQAVGAAVEVLIEAPKGQSVDAAELSETQRKAIEHPLVQEAKELFGARIVRVERVEGNTDDV